MTHKLMIKTHNQTGLKYLCYTKSEGDVYNNYKGSGTFWKKHLKKYGDDITTELIHETNSKEDFKQVALQKSEELDIVESNEWANLRPEQGDGGDTVSNKRWCTNGIVDKYINKDLILSEGWRYGRSNCIFNDTEKQKEFASKATTEARSAGMKNAWTTGKMEKRDHSKCGSKGEANVAKRPEVREKIRAAALRDSKGRSERMKRVKPWEARWNQTS